MIVVVVPEQAASGALYLNSSRVTVYNSLFDRNRGEHALPSFLSSAPLSIFLSSGCCSVVSFTWIRRVLSSRQSKDALVGLEYCDQGFAGFHGSRLIGGSCHSSCFAITPELFR